MMGSNRGMGHVDRRVRKTKEALTDALMELLVDKSLKDITVSELTEMADINRATFYLHYTDIYDMVNQISEGVAVFLSDLIDNNLDDIANGQPYEIMLSLYRYFSKNKSLYSLVFGEHGDLSFVDTMTDIIRNRYFEVVAASADKENALTPEEHAVGYYQYAFVAAGVSSVIRHWLEVDRAETPEEMATITSAFLRQNSQGLNQEALETLESTEER